MTVRTLRCDNTQTIHLHENGPRIYAAVSYVFFKLQSFWKLTIIITPVGGKDGIHTSNSIISYFILYS